MCVLHNKSYCKKYRFDMQISDNRTQGLEEPYQLSLQSIWHIHVC